LPRYINKIESVCPREAQIGDMTVSSANVYISLPYIKAARTAATDKNEDITSLSPYVYGRLRQCPFIILFKELHML